MGSPEHRLSSQESLQSNTLAWDKKDLGKLIQFHKNIQLVLKWLQEEVKPAWQEYCLDKNTLNEFQRILKTSFSPLLGSSKQQIYDGIIKTLGSDLDETEKINLHTLFYFKPSKQPNFVKHFQIVFFLDLISRAAVKAETNYAALKPKTRPPGGATQQIPETPDNRQLELDWDEPTEGELAP